MPPSPIFAVMVQGAMVWPINYVLRCHELDFHNASGQYLIGQFEGIEVRGLQVEDLDFDRGLVIFRPNPWRELWQDDCS